MARIKRGDRKDRKPVEEAPPEAQNGSAVDAPGPKLNGRSNLPLQKVLLQRNLVTEAADRACAGVGSPCRGRPR